ncbi:RDD family protein [Paenibacillus montanisoli]|uniref:RDD family protein n=1 Tax=Paenibacillus montanisoli TaxID=2081970 RepID=A0A328U1R9_9BACL|nr:RDD family protein [Paenibacillus montanisoli]RAP75713.1 RDD family protein [Paenibacillus montanisoli]
MTKSVLISPYHLRLFALFIDYLVISGYGVCLVFLSFLLRPVLTPLMSGSPIVAELTGFMLITLPVMAYFVLSEASLSMGTIGKRKLNLQVVNSSGHRIDLFTSILRSIIKFIPWETAHFAIWRLRLPSAVPQNALMAILILVNAAIVIYLVFPLANKKRKAIHDWVAGTNVIHNRK